MLRSVSIAIVQGDIDKACRHDHRVAIALPQHARRHMHPDQRTAAGGLHGQRRAGQPQPVGQFRRQKVLVVMQGHLKTVGQRIRIAVQQHLLKIGVLAAAGDDPDPVAAARRVHPGILQHMHRAHQKVPLLRIHQHRLLRGNPEMARVKAQGSGHFAARTHLARGCVEIGDAAAVLQDHFGKGIKVGRPRQIDGHSHDGDLVLRGRGWRLHCGGCVGCAQQCRQFADCGRRTKQVRNGDGPVELALACIAEPHQVEAVGPCGGKALIRRNRAAQHGGEEVA